MLLSFMSCLVSRSKHSWRYRQLILLIANLYCFSIEALDIQSEGVSELYIGRVLAFVLLLVTRDAEIGPESLLSEGAGFGLIVNAKHLKQALQAHLSGRTYNRKMARYKATSIRMQETLAISYRWHDENGVDLGNGMELNITEWQTACILQVINTTGCLYVWMDKLAIPATDTKRLQKTLLSRMMAVYSSALVTLVLRSRETDGDRYHQRVWTLQEFCAANQLIVLTEDNDGREGLDEELICTAILDGEDFLVELLRREHMARRGQCVPVWLTDGGATSIMQSVPTDDARQIWETYKKLSTKLHCRYRADTVRALYPLLWNRPAESEPELVALLEALETVHGIPQTGLVELLRESSRREFRQVPNWDGSNGLASPCDVVPKTLLTIVDSPQKSPSPPTSAWSH